MAVFVTTMCYKATGTRGGQNQVDPFYYIDNMSNELLIIISCYYLNAIFINLSAIFNEKAVICLVNLVIIKSCYSGKNPTNS